MSRSLNISSFALIFWLSLIVFPFITLAAEAKHSAQLTAYLGRGADANLVELFPQALKGKLEMDDTHLYALGYFHPLANPAWLQRSFDFLRLPNTRTGFETVIGKHEGLQDNWEADMAWQWRFASLRLGAVGIRPGVGLGFSYALGRPDYEDGPKGHPEKRYRFQNFNIYELEWSLPDASRLALVSRIHHRSGMYGIIAPSRVGSNFLTLGLRYSF